MEGGQRGLRRLSDAELLAPLRPPKNHALNGSINHWLRRLLHGGTGCINSPLEADLGLDLVRHADNIRALCDAWPAGFRLLCRCDLLALRSDPAMPSMLAPVVDTIIVDQVLVLGVVRARLLAEYIRRLATEPMGPSPFRDDPVWALSGATLMDRMVRPALAIDKLMQRKSKGLSVREVIRDAAASGHLALDPRLLTIAREVYQRCGGDALDVATGEGMVAAVRAGLAPLLAITPATLRDEGLGRLGFARARLGLSASEAMTVLAMHLVALRGRTQKMLQMVPRGETLMATSATPSMSERDGRRVCRVTAVLKRISGGDRHVGSTSRDSDNKAGRTLLHATLVKLAEPVAPFGLELLRITPDAWLS